MSASTDRAFADDYESGEGWVLFAGIMLLLGGVLNMIDGIAAVSSSTFFTANAQFVLSDLNTLGWMLIVLATVQILAALGVWARAAGGRWIGVSVASANAVVQIIFIPAYPYWSLALFTLDILVVYGLVAHGARAPEAA